jgi:hypothetical protein
MSPAKLSKTFSNLMFQGKVNAALRLLDQETQGGVLPLTDDVYEDLKKKHPEAKPADASVMITGWLEKGMSLTNVSSMTPSICDIGGS